MLNVSYSLTNYCRELVEMLAKSQLDQTFRQPTTAFLSESHHKFTIYINHFII